MPTVYSPLVGRTAASAAASGSFVQPAPSGDHADPFFDITRFGADPDHSAGTNKAAIDAALAAASTTGGVVWIPAGTFQTTGGHVVPRNVRVMGAGRFHTVISHTGANTCFDFATGAFEYGAGISGLEVIGNLDAAAKGIKIGNTHGAMLFDLGVLGYQTGEAVRIDNAGAPGFSEKVTFYNVYFQNNLINIAFRKNGGLTSVVETKFYGVTMALNLANTIGVDIDSDLVLYGGFIDLKCNIEHSTAIVWRQTGASQVYGNLYNIMAESTGGGTGLSLASGARFTGNGTVYLPAPTTNQINSGATYGIGAVDNDHAYLQGSAVKSGLKVVAADGDVTISNGSSIPHGLFYVRFAGPSREHYLWFYASATGGGANPTISIVGDYTFAGQRVFGDPFFKRLSGDGTNPHLQIPVSNRNGGTVVIASAQFYGEQPQNLSILPATDAGALGAAEGVVEVRPTADNAKPGIYVGGSRDVILYRAAADVLKTDDAFAVGQSAAAPVITNGTTIDTTIGEARVAPGGAVTGIILEAGVAAGQEVWVVNQSAAASTVTMAAAGTSNVADGVGTVIAGLTAAKFVWNSSTSLWYRAA